MSSRRTDDEESLVPAVADIASIIETMAVGLVTLDESWRATLMNPAAAQILGVPATDVIGHDIWTRFPGAREHEFGIAFLQVMATGRPAAFDAYYRARDVWLELRVQKTREGIACHLLDITARKRTDLRAVEDAARAELVANVTASITDTLDIRANVAALAKLVLPVLGDYSIVTVADVGGRLIDVSSWHVDPDRRADVARYAAVRQSAMSRTIAQEAVVTQQPTALMSGAHAAIRARFPAGEARDAFDALVPVGAAAFPMVARGHTVGMLSIYSDSELTPERVELAKDIAARAAFSLDNSLSYERARLAQADAERAGAEAERANQHLALLARVSEALATGNDPTVAVGHLARLVVPQLADWSLVTLADEDHGLRDVGAAHRDASRIAEVQAYAAHRSARMSSSAPLATVLRTGEPVVLAELSEQTLTSAQTDPAMAQIARDLDAHGLAVIPLKAGSRVFGALTLVTTHERGGHTEDELATALDVARRAGPVLDSARAAHQTRRLAESIQRSLLAVPPAGPGLQISTRYRPAQLDIEVGGDWYDHFDLSDGSTIVTIGDVMGHDTNAIAAMAQLRTFMRAFAWAGRHSPADVLRDTDSASRKLGPNAFATALTGELAPAGADGAVRLRWSTAGHPPPAVLSPDGRVEYLLPTDADVPLGVLRAAPRCEHVTTLAPGSVLLLYTDGLIERRTSDLDEGLAELSRILSGLAGETLDALLDKLLVETGKGEPHGDDVALLAVRIEAPGGPAQL